jgi:hypothetical protein
MMEISKRFGFMRLDNAKTSKARKRDRGGATICGPAEGPIGRRGGLRLEQPACSQGNEDIAGQLDGAKGVQSTHSWGATVEDGKDPQICRTVSSGGSFGCNPRMQEIGLGKAARIQRVEIFWPATGKTQVVTDLALDKRYKIRENAESAEEWKMLKMAFVETTPKAMLHTQR